MESDDSDFEAPTNNLRMPYQKRPGVETEGKVKSGEKWLPAPESQLMFWLAEDTGQWVKNKTKTQGYHITGVSHITGVTKTQGQNKRMGP